MQFIKEITLNFSKWSVEAAVRWIKVHVHEDDFKSQTNQIFSENIGSGHHFTPDHKAGKSFVA